MGWLRIVALMMALGLGDARGITATGQCADDIVGLDDRIRGNRGWFTDRGLVDHLHRFGRPLAQVLEGLGPDDHLLDAGSGETIAMAEYLGMSRSGAFVQPNGPYSWEARALAPRLFYRRAETKANVTAVTFTMDDSRAERFRRSPKLNLVTGRLFESLTEADLRKGFGKVSALIDHWGVLPYTKDPSTVLRLVLGALRPGASLFIAVGPRDYDTRIGLGRWERQSSLYRSTVRTRRGTVTFPDWLRSLAGLDVTEANGNFYVRVADPAAVRVPTLSLQSVDLSVPDPPARKLAEVADGPT